MASSSCEVKKEEQWAEDDQWRQERLNHRQQTLGKPEGPKNINHVVYVASKANWFGSNMEVSWTTTGFRDVWAIFRQTHFAPRDSHTRFAWWSDFEVEVRSGWMLPNIARCCLMCAFHQSNHLLPWPRSLGALCRYNCDQLWPVSLNMWCCCVFIYIYLYIYMLLLVYSPIFRTLWCAPSFDMYIPPLCLAFSSAELLEMAVERERERDTFILVIVPKIVLMAQSCLPCLPVVSAENAPVISVPSTLSSTQ